MEIKPDWKQPKGKTTKRKMTKSKDDQKERWPKVKKTKKEDNQNQDEQNGRPPKRKTNKANLL